MEKNIFSFVEDNDFEGFKKYCDKFPPDQELKNSDGETVLFLASKKGHHAFIKYLVQKGVNLESRDVINFTPLHIAAHYGFFKCCKTLLDAGANPNTKDDRYNSDPLISAVYWGFANTVQLLCLYVKTVSGRVARYGYGPLTLAALRGFLPIVKILLRHYANIEERTSSGLTPLIIAARQGRMTIVEYLVENGASIQAETNSGETPLHAAAGFGSPDIVRLLLSKGANTNKCDTTGSTSLHMACNKGNTEVTELLLQHGAKVNKHGEYGRTPLHYAALRKNLQLITLLFQYNADAYEVDLDGKTAMDILNGQEQRDLSNLPLRPQTSQRVTSAYRKRGTLSASDKSWLLLKYEMNNGRAMMNRFIRLCKRQFPLVQGLDEIRFGKEDFLSKPAEFLQIMSKNEEQSQWLLVSTVGCNGRAIRVYDPLVQKNDYSHKTKCKFASQIHKTDLDRGEIRLNIMDVKQSSLNASDTGVLVMAYTTDIMLGLDPTFSDYADIAILKKHVENCLRSNNLTKFPRRTGLSPQTRKRAGHQSQVICHTPILPPINATGVCLVQNITPQQTSRLLRIDKMELFCLCRMPLDNTMMTCCNSLCKKLYHPTCLFGKLPLPQRKDGKEYFLCYDCCPSKREYLVQTKQPNLNDPNLKYDLYVSYITNDIRFVRNKFMKRIDIEEGKGQYKLMIPERDSTIGGCHFENIIENLSKCLKAVAIVSKHYLSDTIKFYEWQQMVFCKPQALAVILLDRPDEIELNHTGYLRTLLASRQYLQWTDDASGQAEFWRKFDHFLGKPLDFLRLENEIIRMRESSSPQ